jgi:probable rRNA maturation factor
VTAAIGVSLDGVRIPVSRRRVANAVRAVLRTERVRDAMISVAFVSRREIQRMNREHLRRNRPTDVIAFGFRETRRGGPVVGDVYISPEVARESARANGIAVREEILRLVVHGTLHVLGHDHPETEARTQSPMWKKQERLVARLAQV